MDYAPRSKKKYVHHLHLYVWHCIIFAGGKDQLPVCSVQKQAPGSPIRNVLIIQLCMG